MLTILKAGLRALAKRDDLSRFGLLTALGASILPEYRFKWPQMDWWRDPAFNAYLTRFGELQAHNTDRRWALAQLLRLVRTVPGDTAECGVFLGSSSWLICRANRESREKKIHHGFDSFEGLSRPVGEDGAYWKGGDLSVPFEACTRNLSEFPDVEIHKGWIPDRFQDVDAKRFSFVHVDVDLYEPTRASVEFFYPRLNAGGVLVCDDYGFSTCPGATRAVDELLAEKPEKMLSLPDGGGFFIKGVTV